MTNKKQEARLERKKLKVDSIASGMDFIRTFNETQKSKVFDKHNRIEQQCQNLDI